MIDPLAPRWRSILLLIGCALGLALLTRYIERPVGRRTTRNLATRAAVVTPPVVPAAKVVTPTSDPNGAKVPVPAAPVAPPPALEPPLPAPHPIASDDAPPLELQPQAESVKRPDLPGAPPPAALLSREVPRLAEEMGRPVAVVSAQVIDPSGRPIARVEAQLGERLASSDSQGEFVLPQKPADLVLQHPDYFPRVIDPELRRGIAIRDAESACERVVVVMFPGARVVGRVVDLRGAPIAGAEIAFDSEEAAAVKTDSTGGFRGPILRPGVHNLHVHHDDYQRMDAPVNLPAGGGEAQFTAALRPGVPIEVRTADRSGAPVPDAGVWLLKQEPGMAEESRFSGRTGDDGRLTLRWNPSDPHSVRIIVPGFRTVVEPLSGERVAITLERAPVLQGQVIERERGLPVRPAEIVLEVEAGGAFSRAPDRGVLFRSLASGKFRVGLPPFAGSYRVRALAEGDLSGASEPIVFDGRSDPAAVTVYLERRMGLRGQVVAAPPGGEPGPVAGARVELYRHDLTEALRLAYGVWFSAPPAPARALSSDAAGSFSFPDLKPAVYRLRVLHPDYADWLSAPVTIPLEAPLPCVLREGGALRGSVLGADGAPQADIPLILASPAHPFSRFTRSDESGRYAFRNLAEDSYLLFTGDPRAEGGPAIQTRSSEPPAARSSPSHAISIRAGAEVVFDVKRGGGPLGSLRGSLLSDGAPLAGAALRVSRGQSPELEVTTGPDGSFRIEGLEPGTYRISAGGLPVEREVEVAGGRTAELAIGFKTLSYRATLTDGLRGTPVEAAGRAELTLERRGAAPAERAAPAPPARSVPVEGGKLVATGLYPGLYRLRVEVPGYVVWEGGFELKPEETLSQEIALRPGNTLRVAVSGPDDRPYRGHAETVLLRDGVEIHRSYGPVDGAVLLPVLPSGSYLLTIRAEEGSTRMRLEVSGDHQVHVKLGKEAAR